MENQQQPVQQQPALDISPAIVMFGVLAILMAVVGLYVTNQDIETTGVTALDSTVPLQYDSGSAGLSGQYPDNWVFDEVGNTLVFTPRNASSSDVTSITLVRNENTSVETIVSGIEAAADEIVVDAENYNDLPDGTSLVVGEADDIEVRYIVFSDGEDGAYIASLRADNVNRYRDELEGIAATVDFLRPLELTQVAEHPEFSVPYPEGFTRREQDPNVVFVAQAGEGIEDADAIIFQFFTGTPLEVLGSQLDDDSTAAVALFIGTQLNGLSQETGVLPVKLGDYFGSRILLSADANRDQLTELFVMDLGSEYLYIITRSLRDDYNRVELTLEAMMDEFAYVGGTPDGSDAVNDARTVAPSDDINFEGDALPLGPQAERTNFTISYPEGWSDPGDAGSNVLAVFENPDDANTMAIQILVGSAEELFGAPIEDQATDEILFSVSQQFTGFAPAADLAPTELGGFAGHEVVLVATNNPQQIAELAVLDLGDGTNYIVISTRSTPVNYGVVRNTLTEMINTFVFVEAAVEVETDEPTEDVEATDAEETSTESTETESTEPSASEAEDDATEIDDTTETEADEATEAEADVETDAEATEEAETDTEAEATETPEEEEGAFDGIGDLE